MSRLIVADVLGPRMTSEIWSGNYQAAFPPSIQEFALDAILPVVFYSFRFGARRGRGRFQEVYADESASDREACESATVARVAQKLKCSTAKDGSRYFHSFDDDVGSAILGDLLLSYCLENRRRDTGRDKPVARVAPVHIWSGVVDLPTSTAHLRFVPELIVALLADQHKGEYVESHSAEARTHFPVGCRYHENPLLEAFSQGWRDERIQGQDRRLSGFDETVSVGLDQLLMVRLATSLGEWPEKARGKDSEQISNQRPVAEAAGRAFSEDIRRFLKAFSTSMPRQTLLVTLEACMALGLTTIFLSVVEIILRWYDTGEVPSKSEQRPFPLFVDATNGTDHGIRRFSEASGDSLSRRVERFPVAMMAARLLDYVCQNRAYVKDLPSGCPLAGDRLRRLGQVMNGGHQSSQRVRDRLEDQCGELAQALGEDQPRFSAELKAYGAGHPVQRLAEVLIALMGRGSTVKNAARCLDSVLMTDRPNGLARSRRVPASLQMHGKKTRQVHSLVLSDAMLEYLVHSRLLARNGKPGTQQVAYGEFLREIREHYGLCVDEAPPDLEISRELLLENRRHLERRLRDLGLLSGVNDAESMKRLRVRFAPTGGTEA